MVPVVSLVSVIRVVYVVSVYSLVVIVSVVFVVPLSLVFRTVDSFGRLLMKCFSFFFLENNCQTRSWCQTFSCETKYTSYEIGFGLVNVCRQQYNVLVSILRN